MKNTNSAPKMPLQTVIQFINRLYVYVQQLSVYCTALSPAQRIHHEPAGGMAQQPPHGCWGCGYIVDALLVGHKVVVLCAHCQLICYPALNRLGQQQQGWEHHCQQGEPVVTMR